ncbi:hypothetical protein ACFW4D_22780 [Paenibacillus lactis]
MGVVFEHNWSRRTVQPTVLYLMDDVAAVLVISKLIFPASVLTFGISAFAVKGKPENKKEHARSTLNADFMNLFLFIYSESAFLMK